LNPPEPHSSDTGINNPAVVAELTVLHEAYEAALLANEVDKLTDFFWDSPMALRFGVAESLYGAEEILAFRRTRPAMDLARKVFNTKIVAFGDDCGIVTIEFVRVAGSIRRHGRQSQVWRRFPEGWKVVSAHVSLVPEFYMEHAAQQIGLSIPEGLQEGVRKNLERSKAIAKPFLDISLGTDIENAPVFEP
jgi:1-carboxybiuret hydrolase subunit AtzH-like protein/1-carboxybiuret hydrolase subunit AtzG-like protein